MIIKPPLLLLLIAWLPLSVSAEANPTPTTLSGAAVSDFQPIVQLITDGALLYDVRNPINFGRGHIRSARLLPYTNRSSNSPDFDASKDQFDLSVLPEDRQKAIIFYSHGITGWKSYKASTLAIRAGYQQVHWYRAGLSDWKDNNGGVSH